MTETRRERILSRLRELGAEPKRSLGQNFLISDMVVDRILAAVRTAPFSEMLEVGPGLGALTEDLLTIGRPLTLLELDRKFSEYWRERAASASSPLRVEEGDALQMDWKNLKLPQETLFVSNLPYQISSSLVIERCLEPAGVTRMILMFQKEVAQRLAAQPRTKEYGLLTVIAQTFWQINTVCDASPQAFYPPPNVSSRVLMFRARPVEWLASIDRARASNVADLTTNDARGAPSAAEFLKFVKAAFSHRRKLMQRNLLGEYYQGNSGVDAASKLGRTFTEQGLLATARAEELDPQAFVRLYLAARLL